MSITLRQLEIFVAVAETQQVTKASERLFFDPIGGEHGLE